MKFWSSLIGYQAVWFAAVIGAGHGVAWPGIVGMLIYAACQLAVGRHGKADLSLMVMAIVLGLLLDGGLIRASLASYATPWPSDAMAPAWILALWATFALTFTQSMAWLQTRLYWATLLGLIGGPLAYLGASHGWHVVTFATPVWRGLLCLAAGWGIATPLLAWLARRWSTAAISASAPAQGRAS